MAKPIHEESDFYVPAFEVRLGQRSLPRDVIRDVMSVQYADSVEDIDSFEITIANWDSQNRTFKYSESDLFDPGNEVELLMGYHDGGALTRMITGEITSLRPSFPAAGQPTLAISGLNLMHRLRTRQESHVYENKTDSDIAKEIAGRLGISIETDSEAEGNEEAYAYVFQDNRYDIVFLMERARRVGYDLFVEEDDGESKLVFGPSGNVRQATYELKYGKSLVEFSPNLSTANQVEKVTVRGWDARAGEAIEATVTRSEIANQASGDAQGRSVVANSYADREEVITDQPVDSVQEAQTIARERLERISKDLITGSGSSVGLPGLRAGRRFELGGFGSRFDGSYFITSTTHAIGDGGYTTQFECRREET